MELVINLYFLPFNLSYFIGKSGGALLFISPEEDAYIELLRGRGVPLEPVPKSRFLPETEVLTRSEDGVRSKSPFLEGLKRYVMADRALLEAGTLAFISFLRAYKENLCSFIFRLDELDIGSVARAYVLLKLPKIPETKSTRKGSKEAIEFEATDINTGLIPFKHKEREDARQRKYQEKLLGQTEPAENESNKKPVKEKFEKNADSNRNGNSNKKGGKDDHEEEQKRKRKKKQSYSQKLKEEWDELAAEEAAFKKFKRGKMSKSTYDDCLMSENAPDYDFIDSHQTSGKKGGKGGNTKFQDSDDSGSDSFPDSDSD